MSKWISVEDKLPEKNSNVLAIYHPYNDKNNSITYAVCLVNEYLEFYSEEAEEFIEFITHWQPLPEPPIT